MNPRNCMFSLKRCTQLYQQTRKHVQVITWLQLNHDSLLIRYLCNSVKCYTKRGMDTIFSFSNTVPQHTMHGACNTISCCSEKLFLRQLWSHQPSDELKWLHYQIYGVVQHRECELQVSNIDEIKQQLVKHWQSINTAFESHDFCVSVFPQIEQTY